MRRPEPTDERIRHRLGTSGPDPDRVPKHLIIVALGATGALVLGTLLTIPLMARRRGFVMPATTYVDAMRCVPFLLFAYLLYFGLPTFGIQFDNWWAGVAALILYHAGYMAELLRAAWSNLPKEQIEAGHAFGFHRLAACFAASSCRRSCSPRCR